MSRDVRDRMHGGCNLANNLNQIRNFKFQKEFANCGVNLTNSALPSILSGFHLI